MSSTVLLRLEGALQSWGTRSRFPERDTETEPSKSGVLGLVGAALGMARDDDAFLREIAACRMAVRVDKEGSLLVDYHTAGAGTFRGKPHNVFEAKDPVLTSRHYLQGASFLVALTYSDDGFAARVDRALGAPVWPLALGRRACVPSLPVRAGTVPTNSPVEAIREARWLSQHAPKDPVRTVLECDPREPGAEPRQDQPLSFKPSCRHFARRFVRTEFIEPGSLKLSEEGTPCISLVAY